MTAGDRIMVAMVVGLLNIALLYRQIGSIGTLTVSLWIGTLLTTFAVIATGLFNFNPAVAFDLPPDAFAFSIGFLLGLGAASRVGIYDYLGYYNICYIGDEVKNPGKVIPRSILISVLAVAVIYIGINLSIIGVVPWREFVPAADHPQSNFIVSIFMERIYGSQVATLFTALVLWTAFGSVFALLLGYSRIPVRGGARRHVLQGVREGPPDEEVPARLAAADRRHRDRLQRAVARHGDRRADHDAHPDPVHRPDRRADAAAQARAGRCRGRSACGSIRFRTRSRCSDGSSCSPLPIRSSSRSAWARCCSASPSSSSGAGARSAGRSRRKPDASA